MQLTTVRRSMRLVNSKEDRSVSVSAVENHRHFPARPIQPAESAVSLMGIIASAKDAIIVVNSHGRIVIFSAAAEELFGCTAAEALGGPIERFIPKQLRAAYGELPQSSWEPDPPANHALEIKAVRADGAEFFTKASLSRAKIPGQRLLVVSFRHVSKQPHTDEQLRRSKEALRALAIRLQSAREEEARRISREIHDEFGQSLASLRMDVHWLQSNLDGVTDASCRAALSDKLKTMQEFVKTMSQTVRRIAADLRPGVLDDLGLEAAIEWLAQGFQERSGVRCRVSLSESGELDPQKATVAFRILQEILTNVARHAQATEVHIQLRREEGHLFLDVRDDGKGISQEDISDPMSLGLLGMRERAMMVDGDLTVQGTAGRGTIVTLRIPASPKVQK
jgi:two-component system sensor kinase